MTMFPVRTANRAILPVLCRDPGLWEEEIVPLLQAAPGLRPVTLLAELTRRATSIASRRR